MVKDRFIELLTKKLSDEIGADELAEFNDLLTNDAECKQHYTFFKSYWVVDNQQYSNTDLMFQRIKNKIGLTGDDTESASADYAAGPRRIFTIWKNVAAVFLAGVCIALTWYLYQHKTKLVQVAAIGQTVTPSRTKSKIVLSDGSVVWLNSETTLKYPLSFVGARTREVYLNGEAFFEVTKDRQHPFIVHTGKMNVRVLGTAFNIKSYANESSSETTLIRGAIEVTLADRLSDRIILKPHDKLILNSKTVKKYFRNKNLTLASHDSVNTNYALTNLTYLRSNDTTVVETSWVNNRFVFKDESFENLATQMERWYGVKVAFKSETAKDYHFTGVFERESFLQALDALKLIESFDYKYKNGTVYIY